MSLVDKIRDVKAAVSGEVADLRRQNMALEREVGEAGAALDAWREQIAMPMMTAPPVPVAAPDTPSMADATAPPDTGSGGDDGGTATGRRRQG